MSKRLDGSRAVFWHGDFIRPILYTLCYKEIWVSLYKNNGTSLWDFVLNYGRNLLQVNLARQRRTLSETNYRPGGCKTICPPPPMAVRLTADLRPSADRSAVRTSLVAGGRPAAGSRHAFSLGWDRQTDRQTDGSRYRLMPPYGCGTISGPSIGRYKFAVAATVDD